MKKVNFTEMKNGTKEDYQLLEKYEKNYERQTAERILKYLSAQTTTLEGYQITRLEHSLQAATRAFKNGEDEEMVVATLLHDIGDDLAPMNHSQYAASILRPYVSEKTYWIIKHHGLFQTYYSAHHLGGDRNATDASALTALGLHALQHRGQEGCGIVTFDGEKYYSEKRFGLVGDNFNKEKVLKNLKGNYAIGHNRYSTTGENTLRNIQPFFADTNAGGIGVAHNGNLTNSISLRNKLVEDGAIFYTTSDTETIVQLIAKSKRPKTIDKVVDAIFQIQGGYALVMLTQNSLIGVRDPYGIRPFVIGKLGKNYVLASETCALDIIGAKFVRDVKMERSF